jgi:hypothetical protein
MEIEPVDPTTPDQEMKTYQVVPTEGNELNKEQDGQTQKAAENSNHVENLTAVPSTKIYRRRWLMLGIFVLVSMINAFQWIQFSIITDVIANYYQVTNDDVNWTSLVYMIVYIPLIFPGAWIMDRLVRPFLSSFGFLHLFNLIYLFKFFYINYRDCGGRC